ncbi:MAG: hypothetical protein H6Q73_2153 [Firmicutes bacterium]|nr:hypothetical protein [Bacillota bacterium]
MKANVNAELFLAQALPITDLDRISIVAYNGILSVASFGNAINFRVPAYVAVPGQAYLSSDEWRKVVQQVNTEKMVYIVPPSKLIPLPIKIVHYLHRRVLQQNTFPHPTSAC